MGFSDLEGIIRHSGIFLFEGRICHSTEWQIRPSNKKNLYISKQFVQKTTPDIKIRKDGIIISGHFPIIILLKRRLGSKARICYFENRQTGPLNFVSAFYVLSSHLCTKNTSHFQSIIASIKVNRCYRA